MGGHFAPAKRYKGNAKDVAKHLNWPEAKVRVARNDSHTKANRNASVLEQLASLPAWQSSFEWAQAILFSTDVDTETTEKRTNWKQFALFLIRLSSC
jgi:hypothetical protein